MDRMASPCTLGVPGVWLPDASASAGKKTEESDNLEAVASGQIDTGERVFLLNMAVLQIMAEPLLFSAIIRALAEKTTPRKHAIASGYQAPDSQIVGHEFEMLNER